jgi:hypothetical protein
LDIKSPPGTARACFTPATPQREYLTAGSIFACPQLLITEVAGPDKYEDWLKKAGHLCPRLLKEELIQFRRLKGYLPRVIVIHIGNPYEQEIKEEVAQVAQELDADISPGYEDMKITL